MKKILIFLVAIILISAILLTFAGCGDSFTKYTISSQITSLRWDMGGTEITTYDIFNKDSEKLGEYTMTRTLVSHEDVEISTSDDTFKPTLDNFYGYKFSSTMSAQLDDATAEEVGYKEMQQVTESYATLLLEPKLSYTKIIKDGHVEEIVTSYDTKKNYVTFLADGAIATDNAKYSSSAFVVDNSFLYQFARATTLSTSLTVVVPTYNTEDGKVQNTSFTCSYANASNIILKDKFVLEKSFSETIASGDVSGEINSGALSTGYTESSGDVSVSDADASGNVTKTYSMVLTSSIPVIQCSFTTTSTFPASGSVSCMIATAKMKMEGESDFVGRVLVRFVEGDITYNLTSVSYLPQQ